MKKTSKNLKLELAAVLRRIGVDMSSVDVATTASVKIAPDGGLKLAGDASRCSLCIKMTYIS